MKRFQMVVLAVAALSATSLHGQEAGDVEVFVADDSRTEDTSEERMAPSLYVLLAQVETTEREPKLRALATLRDNPPTGNQKELVSILRQLGGEGVKRRVKSGKLIINDFPVVRKEAVSLLGEVGGEEARRTLVDLLLAEKEPMVLSEIVVSLSKVGAGEDAGAIYRALSYAIERQVAVQEKDQNFALASINALEKIAEEQGGIRNAEVLERLIDLASPRTGYLRGVRTRAFELLTKLQSY